MEIIKKAEMSANIMENNDGMSLIKKILSEAEQSNEQLFVMKLDQESFLHTIAHDLRGPVNNIEGISELLKESLEKKDIEEIKSLMGYMQHSVKSMGAMIQDLAEERKKNMAPEKKDLVYLPELLEEVMILLEAELKKTGAEVVNHLPVTEVTFNRKYLRCILYAIIANALKYSSAKDGVRISVSSFFKDEFQVICIGDNGPGISKETKDRVFSKKIHASFLKEGSTGISLFVINKMLESNGGMLEMNSLSPGSEILVCFKNQ